MGPKPHLMYPALAVPIMAKKKTTKKVAKATKKAAKKKTTKKAAKKKKAKKAEPELDKDGKPVKKKKKKRKSRKKKTAIIKHRVYWGVFNHAMKRVALYEFGQKKAAEKKVADLNDSGKPPHFVQKVKEEFEEMPPEVVEE